MSHTPILRLRRASGAALGVVACALLLLLICARLAETHAAEDAGFGRYHALVIGNNQYTHLPALKTAVNDASVVADLLRRQYGFEVELLLNATRDQLVDRLNHFRRVLTPNDNLLIYYAGHGFLDEVTDTGFWLPVDAETDSDTRWIANSTITRHVGAIAAKHVLIVADSCYSGTLTRAAPVALRTGDERDAWLERVAGKRSRTALTSGGLEPVSDSGGDGHSIFARQFIEGLRGNTEVLDTQSLYDRIKNKVVLNADQTPRYDDIRKAGHENGDFLFVPVAMNRSLAPARASAETTTGDPTLEGLFWDSIKDSRDPAKFRAYLETYPDGTFVALARLALADLEAGEMRPAAASQSATDQLLRGAENAAPGDMFRDCEICPVMVVIPPGAFEMGAPPGEKGRKDAEGPLHPVTIEAPFAIGKYEISFDEWEACVAAGACRFRPSDESWGRGSRPVINVQWREVQDFLAWLSETSGESYRLPTEAEWEYAARAGSTAARYWGAAESDACTQGNVFDRTGAEANPNFTWWDHGCDDGYPGTAPVGSFAPNPFGLHDMLGNVWEIVADCWHESHENAPGDGTARLVDGCDVHVIRGGSWASRPDWVRSASRIDAPDDESRNFGRGFRVARSLKSR